MELRVPAAGTLKLTVTIMVWLAGKVESAQVMVPPLPCGGPEHAPSEVETELNGSPAGRVAVNTTEFACWFCAFLICHVMVSVVVGPEVGPPFCGEPVT